jgi:hypothetical protein
MLRQFEPIAEQKLGFSFAIPVRDDENSLCVVVPILRETSMKRQYITFPETPQCLVFDCGTIEAMEADNKTDENVFFRSGTIFTGPTQARALQRSTLVFPRTKRKLSVRCVHRTHGIRSGAVGNYSGLTPHEFDKKVYDSGFKPKGQHEYWDCAVHTTNMMKSMMSNPIEEHFQPSFETPRARVSHRRYGPQSALGTPTQKMYAADDLANNIGAFSTHFDEILSKVKKVDHQAGLALITQKGVETIELFDHEDSWKALHEAAVKRLGSNIVQKDDETVFDYKPRLAHRQICRVLALDWQETPIFEHRPDNGEPHVKVIGLSAEDFVGELFEVNDTMIHVLLLKKN